MAITDPISDMLTRIRNAIEVRKETVDIPHSKVKEEISRILNEEGYVERREVQTKKNKKTIRLTLKYKPDKSKVIKMLKRVSKPGRRIYADKGSIPRVLSGFGTAIISTSKGIMTDSGARSAGVGGEVLCYIW